MCDAVYRVAFPSVEMRSIERDGTSEIVYGGLVPRMNAASLGIHSGTKCCCCTSRVLYS